MIARFVNVHHVFTPHILISSYICIYIWRPSTICSLINPPKCKGIWKYIQQQQFLFLYYVYIFSRCEDNNRVITMHVIIIARMWIVRTKNEILNYNRSENCYLFEGILLIVIINGSIPMVPNVTRVSTS